MAKHWVQGGGEGTHNYTNRIIVALVTQRALVRRLLIRPRVVLAALLPDGWSGVAFSREGPGGRTQCAVVPFRRTVGAPHFLHPPPLSGRPFLRCARPRRGLPRPRPTVPPPMEPRRPDHEETRAPPSASASGPRPAGRRGPPPRG